MVLLPSCSQIFDFGCFAVSRVSEHRETYTVKVPPQWAGINSSRAREWLRSYFVHPVELLPDPGGGDRVLRLTLDERMVVALSRRSGDVPAIALRRLLAAHIRELPPASSVLRPQTVQAESPSVHVTDDLPLAKSYLGQPSQFLAQQCEPLPTEIAEIS